MQKILVSACLLGERVRYHGGDAACGHPVLRRWLEEGRLVAVCPERDGGLPTPRPPAELVGIVVRTAAGVDVTEAFRRGAQTALDVAKANGIRIAILKDGSPSCASSFVYDGTFSGTRTAGKGVTATLLEANGVRVFNEHSIDAANQYVRGLEETP